MNDTPQDIYDLQLKLWIAKPPMERLHRLMTDNAALLRFWREVKPVVNTGFKKNRHETMNKLNFNADDDLTSRI